MVLHNCLMMPLLGPNVLRKSESCHSEVLDYNIVRRVAYQLSNALAYLHSVGIGHGATYVPGDLLPITLLMSHIRLSHQKRCVQSEWLRSLDRRPHLQSVRPEDMPKARDKLWLQEPPETPEIRRLVYERVANRQ